MRELLIGTVVALMLVIGPVHATDDEPHTPLPGYYNTQTEHTFHLDDDGSYQIDRALLCDCIKKGKPNSNFVRELTFRCQGHPYPHVKPVFSISKERWYATTFDGKLFLVIVDTDSKNIRVMQHLGENP
jgi:hypothetical protein